MNQKYAVIFEQAERNWAAYVPDLPGCITTGKTIEETERNIREAIEGHLRTLREFGDPAGQRGGHGCADKVASLHGQDSTTWRGGLSRR